MSEKFKCCICSELFPAEKLDCSHGVYICKECWETRKPPDKIAQSIKKRGGVNHGQENHKLSVMQI